MRRKRRQQRHQRRQEAREREFVRQGRFMELHPEEYRRLMSGG